MDKNYCIEWLKNTQGFHCAIPGMTGMGMSFFGTYPCSTLYKRKKIKFNFRTKLLIIK